METESRLPLLWKPLQIVLSCYFWFEVFAVAALMTPISVIIFILTIGFDKKLTLLHRYTCLWAYISLKINPLWKVRVIGREKINRKATYVMVSNHQSGADIIVLFLLWNHFKWIAKGSLFRAPFIGWNMSLNGYIALDRGSMTSIRKMMTEAGELLREGNSVMIFPEGTRSADGNLQPFKTGAFLLALQNQVPILPVAISGTAKAIRKNGFLINRNPFISATVLEPIPFSEIKSKEPKEIAGLVHAKITEAIHSSGVKSEK
jgi:1-acyl-sn-glycerol-3-phosphate acyltransferase